MMNQLSRAMMKSSRLIKTAHHNQCLVPTFFSSPKLFSAQAAEPSRASSDDLFMQTPTAGRVYGTLLDITKHTTKTDVINLLEGCDLNPHNLKVDYNRSYIPMSMIVEFPSRSAYDAALRAIVRKGRLYRLSKTDKAQWDAIAPFDGKAILIQGIPRNALIDDVERFLSGCQYDSSNVQLFARQTNEGAIRFALVRFPSQVLASHAYVTKSGGFCLNNKISLQVLQ